MVHPTQCPSWAVLEGLYEDTQTRHLRDQFAEDSERFDRYSLSLNGLLFDYSKHRVDDRILEALFSFAREMGLKNRRDALFAGARINTTEGRSVFHIALRNQSGRSMEIDGQDVMPQVRAELEHMRQFVTQVHGGTWTGFTGKSITDVVNIGIGGSDLGPAMVYDALWAYHRPGLRVHFVSNVDGTHVHRTMCGLDPETTLFIVASKSFSTQETLTNARSARTWFLNSAATEIDIARHFVALSTNRDAVMAFGINPDNMFQFWDWVGGRFSVWSAIGLSVALGIGMDNFEALLAGAHEMDEHFRVAPFETNIPVIMALLGVWYGNLYGCRSHGILPYDQGLARFPAYLQQAEMESNGKSVTASGESVTWATCPVIFGEPGTNGQHAFYQLLHQGTQLIPVDFIVPIKAHHDLDEHHRILLANCLAQSEALMIGRTADTVHAELEAAGMSDTRRQMLAPHKVFAGNRPSTTIMLDDVSPRTLGMLVAAYEHKIFVQGVLWNVLSYDQWGVELGKVLARKLQPKVDGSKKASGHDASTLGLLKHLQNA